MPVFLLTWDPDGEGWPDPDYQAQVDGLAGNQHADRWSVAIRKSGISRGDRAFLMRQHHERGLVASGTFTGGIYTDQHWDGSGRLTTYAPIKWEHLLPVEDRLPVEDLKAAVPGVAWDRLQGSGVLVRPPDDGALEALWASHVQATPHRLPGEYKPGTYEEGAVTRVEVNRYERDPAARRACIAHHGTACAVCGFDFEQTYGKIGRDFVHVHHLREISTLGPGYQIDPVQEMRPLCANCHSMAHRRRPALTPKQLQAALRRAAR